MAGIALPCHDLPHRLQQQMLRRGSHAAAQGHGLRMQDVHQVGQARRQLFRVGAADGQGRLGPLLRRLEGRPALHAAIGRSNGV